MRVNCSNIIVTGILGMAMVMPEIAKVSIFTDNDLTHITDDHFEIKLITRLLDQMYVIQPPMLPPRYDDAPPGEYEYSQPSTSIGSTTPSAPHFPEHLHSLLTRSEVQGIVTWQEFLIKMFYNNFCIKFQYLMI